MNIGLDAEEGIISSFKIERSEGVTGDDDMPSRLGLVEATTLR